MDNNTDKPIVMYYVDEEGRSFQVVQNNRFARRIGFTKKINITNGCNKKAYVIVTPSKIKTISKLGIDGIGSIEFENKGEDKSQEMLILPNHTKVFELDTKNIYLTILIEIEENTWKQLRKNRKINCGTNDYKITPNAIHECVEVDFLLNLKK